MTASLHLLSVRDLPGCGVELRDLELVPRSPRRPRAEIQGGTRRRAIIDGVERLVGIVAVHGEAVTVSINGPLDQRAIPTGDLRS